MKPSDYRFTEVIIKKLVDAAYKFMPLIGISAQTIAVIEPRRRRMDSNRKLIYWFDELGQGDNDLVGKKCANLGELTQGGFRVPPGFAMALQAYDYFMTETGAAEDIRQYFNKFSADPDNPKDLPKFAEASKVIRDILESKAVPEAIGKAIEGYYKELCQKAGVEDIPVATRSAGPASHPGQYETYLYIMGKSEVTTNIIRVWSSTFNARSIVARARKGLDLGYDPIGVAVLQMVDARAAGIMFTAEPTTGESSKIVIEGNWGLGESVVSGAVSPDNWIVDKNKLTIIGRRLSTKLVEHIFDPAAGKAMNVEISPERSRTFCLSDEEVVELARVGTSIEQHFGKAQDVEWAVDQDSDIVILQTRPEKFHIELRFAGF